MPNRYAPLYRWYLFFFFLSFMWIVLSLAFLWIFPNPSENSTGRLETIEHNTVVSIVTGIESDSLDGLSESEIAYKAEVQRAIYMIERAFGYQACSESLFNKECVGMLREFFQEIESSCVYRKSQMSCHNAYLFERIALALENPVFIPLEEPDSPLLWEFFLLIFIPLGGIVLIIFGFLLYKRVTFVWY